jgi:hypothetical protein
MIAAVLRGIMSLLFGGRPTTVLGRVTFSAVYAVYRQIIAITVGKRPIPEGFIVRPFDVKPASAVPKVSATVRVVAPGQHSGPNAVNARSMTPSRVTVRRSVQFRPFRPKAAAGFDFAKSQQFPLRNVFVATCATATPKRTFVGGADEVDHRQSPENLSRDIGHSGHVNLFRRFACQVTGPIVQIGSVAHSTAGFP